MKLKFCFSIFLIAYSVFRVYAQTSVGKISGIVVDAQNIALPSATVKLYKTNDSTSHQIISTDKNGAFVFNNLANATYGIIISSIGLDPFRNEHITIDAGHPAIALPVIVLQASKRALNEIVITDKKPLIEQKTDRTIVNVEAMITAVGGNALEALSKSPGVIVDANDNISLNGKSNVLVLIDDRPTYMSGQDLAAYLRSLPAGMLDKLELMSNPPARYDASGGAVINIVLKKTHAAGVNGGINIGYNQGVYVRSNNALNINYRTTKFNLFSSMSYSLDQNYSKETFSRYFYDSDNTLNSLILENSRYFYRSDSWNGRFGLDYFVSANTTLGIMLTGNTRPKRDLLNYTNNQYDGTLKQDSAGSGYTSGQYQLENTSINLNGLHKFGQSGTQISADLDYIHFYSYGNQLSPVDIYFADGSLSGSQQRIFHLPASVNIYSGKSDFTHLLPGKGEFNVGIKSSFVKNDNQLDWFNQAGSALLPDYSRTNHFRYSENINSAYVNLKKEGHRWGLQGGLRIENTVARGHQFSNPAIPDSSFKKNYTHLFPSVYISYKVDTAGHSILVISYNQRIRRPGYQQLNPFLFYRDQYSYSSGNPALVPYYNQYYELRYAYRQYIGITAGYSVGNNESQPLTEASGNVLISRPYNFINNSTYSLVPYFSLEPTRWWTFRVNAVLLYILNKGSAGEVTIRQKTNQHEIETTNELQLAKTWSAEVDGFFPGKQSFGQIQGAKAGYNISGGIRKTIAAGQGAITLNVNDIFHTLNFATQTIGINGVSAFSTRQTDTRHIGFAFSWHFGKAANARKRNHNTGGAEEEKGRTD